MNDTAKDLSREAALAFVARHGLAMRGPSIASARTVVIAIHGRGASAENILGLADVLALPDIAFVAPQAMGGTWYPYSFMAPREANEPHLGRALAQVTSVIADLVSLGVPTQSIALMGFSQGACLALEVAARNPMRYGAVIAFSGGLIGPPGTVGEYPGDLAGTPIFLGCSDVDPHIPLQRVEESAAALGRLRADVKSRIYPGFGHAINDDEIAHARGLLNRVD